MTNVAELIVRMKGYAEHFKRRPAAREDFEEVAGALERLIRERDAAVEELNHRVDHMKAMELRVNELEAALAAPLPEEVRGLSDWLYSFAFDANCAFNEDQREHLEQVAQALERMARAQTRDAIIARLRKENAAMREALQACVADHKDSGCFRQATYDKARAALGETEGT